jgi:hypothetical protein
MADNQSGLGEFKMNTNKATDQTNASGNQEHAPSESPGVHECSITEGSTGLLCMNFSRTAIYAGEQCFVEYGVRNSQVFSRGGKSWEIPVIDFSRVLITPTAHKYFTLTRENPFTFLLAVLAIRVHHTTCKGHWLTGKKAIKGLQKVGREIQHFPVRVLSGVCEVQGENPSVHTLICAPEFEEIADSDSSL